MRALLSLALALAALAAAAHALDCGVVAGGVTYDLSGLTLNGGCVTRSHARARPAI